MIITIKKDGFYEGDDILESLGSSCHFTTFIEDNVTLEDIFDSLIKYEEEVNVLFSPYTRGFKLRPYYEELKKNPDKETDITYLDVSRYFESFEYEDDDCKITNELNQSITITGFAEEMPYNIGLSHLNNLKNLPILLDKKVMFGDKQYEMDFTLMEVIGAILYEISYHGYPEDRNSVSEDLNEIAENIDSGTEKTISMDEMLIDFYEKELERLIENEKYEKAEKVKKHIEELKKAE
jgi:hypothetical protein